jgi:hypothetical protein
LQELRVERNIELEASQEEYLEDDGPPLPTVKELDSSGKMTITFS